MLKQFQQGTLRYYNYLYLCDLCKRTAIAGTTFAISIIYLSVRSRVDLAPTLDAKSPMKLLPVYSALLLLLTACHDAPRKNPFDPALTPAVELQATLDDTASTAALTWTPYQGDIPFAAYQILRNIADRVTVDTLATFTDINALTYTDTSLATNTTYAYRVAIRNSAGFAAISAPITVRPLQLPSVARLRAEFDSGTASATLTWSPYRGPRFSTYQVLRRIGSREEIVAELNAVEDTTFTDTSLDGAIDYTYQIIAQTERGEIIEGTTASGGIHKFVAEWPIDIIPIAVLNNFGFLGGNTFPRIWIEGDEIRMMGNEEFGTYLLRFSKKGLLLSSQWLASTEVEFFDMAQSRDGRLWFVTSDLETELWLLSAEPDGQLRKRSHDLFTDALATPFAGDQAVVQDRIALVGALGQTSALQTPYISAANLTVTRDGTVLYRDFTPETEVLDAGWHLEQPDAELAIYRLGPSPIFPWGGIYSSFVGWLFWTGSSGESFHSLWRDGEDWSDFALQADLRFRVTASGGIAIGSDTFSRFTLALTEQDQAQFNWTYVAADGSTSEQNYTQPFPISNGFTYRLSLEAVQGRVRARVEAPIWWNAPLPQSLRYINQRIADLDGSFAITVNNQAFHVTAEGEGELIGELPDMVNYLKTWERNGRRFLGAVMPESGRIAWGPIIGAQASNWPRLLRRSFGPFLNDGDGSLRYPTAFAVGPDGRFYVLDGANYRVVVFNEQGEYITQWGTRGSGPGQFNLGSGDERMDTFVFKSLAGDITVDDEGFVYVVDHDNLRIQKFAP